MSRSDRLASEGKAGLAPGQVSYKDVYTASDRVDTSPREANAAKVMDALFVDRGEDAWIGGQAAVDAPSKQAKNVEKAIDALWSSGPPFDDEEEEEGATSR